MRKESAMKKFLSVLLVLGVLASLLCVTAVAEGASPETAGIYGIAVESGYTSTVTVTVPGISSSSATIGEKSETFYSGAEKVSVSYHPGTASGQFMVFVLEDGTVPTKDNIVYINQDAASSNTVEFANVYPSALNTGKTYNIYLSNSTLGYVKVASFKYYEPYLLGDADTSHEVDLTDASYILQYYAKLRTLDAIQMKAADVNKDTEVDMSDASFVLQYYAKLIDSFEEVAVK